MDPNAFDRDFEHKEKLLKKWDRYFPHESQQSFDVSTAAILRYPLHIFSLKLIYQEKIKYITIMLPLTLCFFASLYDSKEISSTWRC